MPCLNVDNVRVIRNRHGEACGTPDTCPGCLPCPDPHCLACSRAHVANPDAVACPRCIGQARTALARIRYLSARLANESVNGRDALHVRGIPGGDALVYNSPAATTHGHTAQLLHRFLFGLDTTHVNDERRNDPNPPLAVLTHWENRTRTLLAQPTDLAPTLDRAADYLNDHLNDAARDVSFVPLARTLAATVRRLEDVLEDGDRPERSRVPCLECGTRLEKVYADNAAADYWTCPTCGERYDRGRFDRAKYDHLASEGADRYVFVPDAAAALGRPQVTVRKWIRDGTVATTRDAAGRLVAWWPDIRAAHLITAIRKTKRTP